MVVGLIGGLEVSVVIVVNTSTILNMFGNVLLEGLNKSKNYICKLYKKLQTKYLLENLVRQLHNDSQTSVTCAEQNWVGVNSRRIHVGGEEITTTEHIDILAQIPVANLLELHSFVFGIRLHILVAGKQIVRIFATNRRVRVNNFASSHPF